MSDIETTLWSSLLRESSKKFKVPQAACVVIGDVDVGKRKLVDNMCNSNKLSNNQQNMTTNNIKTDIVSYNYLDYEEYDNDTSVSKIHMWTLGLQTFDKAFEILVSPKKIERIAIIITLDLTKDNIIDALNYWLRKSKQYSQSFHSELNKEVSDNYKLLQAHYIQSIKNNKGAIINQQLEDVKTNCNTNDINNIGLPIIVVGCKSDIIKLDDVSSSRKAKETQSKLRAICLQTNCALIYTSAVKNINCQKLGKYIMHRLYHDIIPFPDLSIEDGTDNIFIPAGFDTKDLISIATGVPDISIQSIDLDKPISFEEDNQRKLAASSSRQYEVPNNQVVEIESEDEWIAGLQNFISQVTATGAAPPSTSSSNIPATNNVTDSNKNATKRASVRAPVALEEKQDVDDFFKSLLKK